MGWEGVPVGGAERGVPPRTEGPTWSGGPCGTEGTEGPPWVLGIPRGCWGSPVGVGGPSGGGSLSRVRTKVPNPRRCRGGGGAPGQGGGARTGAPRGCGSGGGAGGSLVGQSPGERGSVIRTRCSGGSPRYGQESHFWGGPSFLIPQRGPGGTGGGLGTARVPPIGPGARQPLRERGSPLGPPPSSARSRRGPTPGTCWAVVPAAPAKPQQKPFSAGALPVPPHRCHSPCPPLSPRSSGTPRAPSPIAPGWEFPSAPRESSAAGAGLRLSRSRARVFFWDPLPAALPAAGGSRGAPQGSLLSLGAPAAAAGCRHVPLRIPGMHFGPAVQAGVVVDPALEGAEPLGVGGGVGGAGPPPRPRGHAGTPPKPSPCPFRWHRSSCRGTAGGGRCWHQHGSVPVFPGGILGGQRWGPATPTPAPRVPACPSVIPAGRGRGSGARTPPGIRARSPGAAAARARIGGGVGIARGSLSPRGCPHFGVSGRCRGAPGASRGSHPGPGAG